MDYLSWSRHFRNMPGQGDLPLADFAEAIHRLGYRGYWSLEIFNDRFRAGSASGVAVDGFRSLQFLYDQVASRPRAPTKRELPARVNVADVEFIEFAASDSESVALGAMLTALGFVPTAQHRRKAVTRWQQGGINIVMNCEPEDSRTASMPCTERPFARSAFASTTCRLLSIARSISPFRGSPKPLVGRDADSLGQRHRRKPPLFHRGRHADGCLGAQFTHPVATNGRPRSLGLRRIDHIARDAVRGVLVVASLLRGAIQCHEDAADRNPPTRWASCRARPSSRESRAAHHAQRLDGRANPLVAISSPLHGRRRPTHAHSRPPTSSPQSRLRRANGLERLEIPRNYYDDVESKFGLAPELVARLAQNGILYDRDGAAEYFQFYSRAFAKRVFFEIVERRGYQAYGAANASIRLAAQARFKGGGQLDCARQSHENGATQSARSEVTLGSRTKTARRRSADRGRGCPAQYPRGRGEGIRRQGPGGSAWTRSRKRSTRRSG